MSSLSEQVKDLVREGFDHEFGAPVTEGVADQEWQKLRNVGTRLWLDTGDIDEAKSLWVAEFQALTTNNTLLNREVQKGIYDELVSEAAGRIRAADPDISEQDLVIEIAFVLNARHGLKLVHEFDARVSVELHTDMANDIERTVAYGLRFYAVCPQRFIVKVPLTPSGLVAARKLKEQGIPINFTLGFSARHNYVAALLTKPSYVNVFMGRLNAFVADSGLGDGVNVGEKATLSTQRELLAIRDTGKSATLLIGASMRGGEQVATLAGLDVYTIPPKVAAQYRENPTEIRSRVQDDPPVTTADGVELSDFSGATLWDVPDAFKKCTDELVGGDVMSMTGDSVQAHFAQAGFGDFLPQWSDDDIAVITRDGKIPIYETWKERLASGELGLDALMNMSALRSFATDQKALDDRIRSLL